MVIELFHAEGRTNIQREKQTDMPKLTVPFRNFAKAPKTDQWETKLSENMEPILQRGWKLLRFRDRDNEHCWFLGRDDVYPVASYGYF